MAKKKPIIEEKPIIENISVEPLDDIMGDRYGVYAKYVIQDRAIPDARDGLKPVQRRIIYSMFVGKNTSKNPTRKCARIVGDVIGKYHPHGDTSVYDALARMSQDWKVRIPLIDFQGNNGSINGDPPAAYRYTEARLSELADELVKDLEKEACDMTLTFDDTQFEPVVLPAHFPNLLINGCEGIAVAMATEIPPHNLQEVVDAVVYRINHVRVTSLDLMQFVKGPDFPTGGIVYATDGLRNIYETGRGRIEISSKAEIVNNNGTTQIVITEFPYKVAINQVAFEIDKIRHDKVIDGIDEVRDESDRHGLRLVVDCKKGVNAESLLKFLMNKTSLRTGYSANMVAIVDGRPKTMNLLDFVDCYINHQVDVLTRTSKYDLNKASNRLVIVDGLIKAISVLDDVVNIIRASKDKGDAKTNLENKFGFTPEQSEAIVMMQLYKLTNTDVTVLKNEKETLMSTIEYLKGILEDRDKLNRVLVRNLKEVAKKYSDPRRTEILENEEVKVYDKRDLIAKEDVMVAITRDGYFKRSSIKSYRSSESLPGMKDGDTLVHANIANTTDYVVGFTNLGNYFILPVNDIPDVKWKDEGKHLNSVVKYNAGIEKIIKVFTISKFRDNIFFTFISKKGQIKRVKMSEFELPRCTRVYPAMRLMEGDEIASVIVTCGNDNLFIITANGNVSCYNESCLNPLGTKAGGIKGVAKLGGDYVVGMLAYHKEEKGKIFILTDHGHTRIYEFAKTPIEKRLAKFSNIMPTFKNDPHKIMYVQKIENTDKPLVFKAVTSLKGVIDFSINEFYLTPMEKYAKTNLDITKKNVILRLFTEGEKPLDPNMKSEYVEVVKTSENITDNLDAKIEPKTEEKKEEEKDPDYKQISIFDED